MRSRTDLLHQQLSIDDLGTPLFETTFVVVDLETTGTRSATSAITEIGAVKVRGGTILGEFQTLVNPGGDGISPFVTSLTGITNAMVADAPRIDAVLPMFFEFAHGTVLVAHNAPFDVGFLKSAASRLEVPWPGFKTVDTVKVARAVVTREEVRNHKLSTLAAYFGAATTPDHRALTDARATVDVLHGLIGRLGSQGVGSLEELAGVTSTVTPATRSKSYLAKDLPDSPGVYLFTDASSRVLYVGTSGNIRTRVKNYFTGSETRSRMGEMVRIAEKVTPVECPTVLEARVRELRLIAEHKPPYNRRDKSPERAPWVKLTAEVFPRLSIVRDVRDDQDAGARYLGPFSSHAAAVSCVDALQDAYALRRCRTPVGGPPCAAAQLGKCGGPCAGVTDPAEYAVTADRVRNAMSGDVDDVVAAAKTRIKSLSAAWRYEEAASARDRLLAYLHAVVKTDEARMLAVCRHLAAARRTPSGGWEIAVIRHGRLAGTAVCARHENPYGVLAGLNATAEQPAPPVAPRTAAMPSESALVARWLAEPGVRLIEVDGELTCTRTAAPTVLATLGAHDTSPRGNS